MDRLISEQAIINILMDNDLDHIQTKDGTELIQLVQAIPPADMFSDLKAEISMYENNEQSIDEMIQGIKSIISIYVR